MSTAKILQFFRDQEPRFSDEPDEKLINFIGSTQKAFLQDEEFKKSYQDVLRGQMEATQTPEGRQEVITESGLEDLTLREDVAVSAETALKSGIKGALDVFASVPKSIALGASGLDKLRGKDTPPEEFVTYQLGELLREAAEEKFPIDEQARETWSAKIGQGLGSAAAFLAGGALGKTAGVSGTSIALLGSAATSNEFYEDAKRSGANEDTAFRAALIGAGVGLSEIAPLNKILNKIPGSKAVGFKKTLLDAVTSGAEEIAQENLQSAAQNITAQKLGYDPDRGTFEGFEEATVVGGTTGALLSLLASALGVRYRGRVQPQAEETTTPQTDQAVQEAGPVPVATEPADVITGGRTEEEILATAPELPTAPQTPQEQLEARQQQVEARRAELLESATRETSPSEAIQEAQDLDLEVEGLESEVSQLQSQAETEPSAEATLALETKQKELDSKRQQVEARRSELLEETTPVPPDKVNALIQEAQDLDLELDALTTEVQQLQTQAEAEPTTEATAALESKQQELDTKRQQVDTKRQEATEAALEASEQEVVSNIEAEQQSPFEVDPETDPVAERAGFATAGIVDPSLRPFLNYKDGKIEFNIEGLFNLGDKVREKLFGGKVTDAANRVSNFLRTQASGLKNNVATLVNGFETTLSNVFKDAQGKVLPSDQRDIAPIDALLRDKNAIKNLDLDSFAKRLFAHRGPTYVVTEADKQLAKQTVEFVDQARKMIDFLTQKMVDSGLVAEKNLPTFEQGIGEYLTRSYKVFNKAYDWNWNTIPKSIKDAAVKDIRDSYNKKHPASPMTEQQAMETALELTTDRDKAFAWSIGLTAVNGVPVRLLYKRKQLSKPMRELLGEIKDPVTNTLITLDKQINLLMGFQMQNQLAELLVESGMASHEVDKSKGFTQQVFDNNFALGIQSKRKYPSLRPLYTTEAYAKELQSFFIRHNSSEQLGFVKRAIKRLAGITKYNLVVLNPAAYSTQYIAAVYNEARQGRLLWPSVAIAERGVSLPDQVKINAKAAGLLLKNRKLRKQGTPPPSLESQEEFVNTKASEFLKDPVKFIEDNSLLMEDLAYRYGALNDVVNLRIIEELLVNQRENDLLKDLTAKRMWAEMGKRLDKKTLEAFGPMKGMKEISKALTKIYGGGDQAGKMNAFLVETLGEAASNPDATMDEVMSIAAKKTVATTPTTATIAPSIKEASAFSLLNAFISWQVELVRNTYNQAAIASLEMSSSNPVEKSRGTRRAVTGAIGIASAVVAGRTILEALMGAIGSNDDEYTSEAGDWIIANLLPEWDQDQSVAVVKFDKDGFAYTPLSYVMPDALLGIPFKAAMRGESLSDSIKNSLIALQRTVGGRHPLLQAFQILLDNYDPARGVKVANEELPAWDQAKARALAAGYVVAPGIAKTLGVKLPRILSDGKKPFGREYTVQEELYSYMGVRTYGYEWEGALRGQMQNFERRLREAKRIVPKRDIDELIAAGKPEEAKALQDKEDARIQAIAKEYSDLYVGALKHVPGLTRKQLDSWQKNITATVGGGRLSRDLTTPAAQAANAAGY
jgi:hypothetical protein